MKSYTCLYVEDEFFLREEIARFLKRRVGKLILAENGMDGLEKFNQFPIDFVITDLKMPVMDGLEMTKKIRISNENVPIIITTALSDIELMKSSIEIGVDRYILKPIDIDELTATLESIEKKLQKRSSGESIKSINPEDGRAFEKKIESEIARIIKSSSGKGPQKVTAFLRTNIIEIVISGSRTILEQTLIKSDANHRIADYVREIYYQQIRGEIESVVKEITGYHGILGSSACNSQKDIDIIKLIL